MEAAGDLARVAVLAEQVAVVGDQDEQRPLHDPELARPSEEPPEPAVDHGDLRGVERPHAQELAVREVVVLAVVVAQGLLALVALVVEAGVVLGGSQGSWGS